MTRLICACVLVVLTARSGTAQTLVFGSDGAIVFTRVHLDKVEQFESIMTRTRDLLRNSDNPVRQQQAESWKVFRVTDPTANGIAIYVFTMTPVVKSADYNLSVIFAEELSEREAKLLDADLKACLAAPQFAYPMEAVALPDSKPLPVKAPRATAKISRRQ